MFNIDPEVSKIGFTIACTFATTIVTVGKTFHGAIAKLNEKIEGLSNSVAALDKNVAIQSAIFDKYINRE